MPRRYAWPLPPMAGGSEGETPDAQALLGDATVVESGATDASTETSEDNSVHVEIVAPPAPPVEPVAVAEVHCEHCEQHAEQLAALESRITELTAAAEVAAVAEEAEIAAVPVEPAPSAPAEPEPDVAPKREHALHHKLFSRSED